MTFLYSSPNQCSSPKSSTQRTHAGIVLLSLVPVLVSFRLCVFVFCSRNPIRIFPSLSFSFCDLFWLGGVVGWCNQKHKTTLFSETIDPLPSSGKGQGTRIFFPAAQRIGRFRLQRNKKWPMRKPNLG